MAGLAEASYKRDEHPLYGRGGAGGLGRGRGLIVRWLIVNEYDSL